VAAPKASVLGSSKTVSLEEDVFGAEVKPHLVHETVRAEQNAARANTRGGKSRGLVAGGAPLAEGVERLLLDRGVDHEDPALGVGRERATSRACLIHSTARLRSSFVGCAASSGGMALSPICL